jgi:hypothetical protein
MAGPGGRGLPGGIMCCGEPGDPADGEPAAIRGAIFIGATAIGPGGRPTPPLAALRGDIFCFDLGLGWLGILPPGAPLPL